MKNISNPISDVLFIYLFKIKLSEEDTWRTYSGTFNVWESRTIKENGLHK